MAPPFCPAHTPSPTCLAFFILALRSGLRRMNSLLRVLCRHWRRYFPPCSHYSSLIHLTRAEKGAGGLRELVRYNIHLVLWTLLTFNLSLLTSCIPPFTTSYSPFTNWLFVLGDSTHDSWLTTFFAVLLLYHYFEIVCQASRSILKMQHIHSFARLLQMQGKACTCLGLSFFYQSAIDGRYRYIIRR